MCGGIFLLAEAFYIGKHGLHPNFKRAETYFKEAILLGCADGGAHFHLGCMEFDQDRLWSSFRHLLIAVALGCYDRTLDRKNAALVRLGVRTGMITKAAYEVALRVRQSRLEATRTEGREKFGRCSRLSYNRGLRGTRAWLILQVFNVRGPRRLILAIFCIIAGGSVMRMSTPMAG